MKPSALIALLLAPLLCLTACGPAKVKGPEPDPAGRWEWKGSNGITWQLDLKPDGSFRREILDPANAKPIVIKGNWSLFTMAQKEPTWLESHGLFQKPTAEDKRLRAEGFDPGQKDTKWSGTAMLTLHYTAPAGSMVIPTTVLPTATPPVAPATPLPAAPPSDMVVGETQAVRTHTEINTGKAYLHLGGKTYHRIESSLATTPDNPEPTGPAPATPSPATPALDPVPAHLPPSTPKSS